jgi:hypothetical protein
LNIGFLCVLCDLCGEIIGYIGWTKPSHLPDDNFPISKPGMASVGFIFSNKLPVE